jgi:hypothetical protein
MQYDVGMPEITIDPEFKDLGAPLTAEESAQLELNLKAEGCRDPLVVWSKGNVLLDGHNRYEICERLNLVYEKAFLDLADRDAAMDWIDANQLGRRNLKPDQVSLARGRMYLREKKRQGTRTDLTSGQTDPKSKHDRTSEAIARKTGVS